MKPHIKLLVSTWAGVLWGFVPSDHAGLVTQSYILFSCNARFWKLAFPLMSNSMIKFKALPKIKADVEDDLCYLISLKFPLRDSWKPIPNRAVPCKPRYRNHLWLKTGSICCAQQCGRPLCLSWVSLWSRWGDMSWNKLVSCFGTHKTPTCHSSTAFHQYPLFPRALTHPGSPPFLQLKHFPSQYHCKVTWKRNLAGWGFPMQRWRTLTEPPPKMFVPLVPTCVCNCTCWKEPTTTVEIKAIQHATPRSLFWLPSQMWR